MFDMELVNFDTPHHGAATDMALGTELMVCLHS